MDVGGGAATSEGVTTAGGGVKTEVSAVRARERVHRRPPTVVVKSCGVAMRKSTHRIEKASYGLRKGGEEEKNQSTTGAWDILEVYTEGGK